ncbi:B-lymphocyte antigen CD20 isoform X1 [Anabas testudineus]|uniref:B-lymphocyte antigen CD20 isoform X1 n=1 Tax=Anabas testudineus TaxID=64144 RepID=UPI000E459806|nr:B-lymphocyte antigen CD20 isoform X1 [Anabas testudineus]
MSISMTKANDVTVLTLTSDPQSSLPPLCQILKALCYNPVCCTVSEHLRRIQRNSQSVLGTLHIMVGLLNIGLGLILLIADIYVYPVEYTFFPVWLGILFIIFGITCILSEKYPSPCLVIVNVILNLAGVAFAITAVTLYGITMGNIYLRRNCATYYWYDQTTPSPSSRDTELRAECMWNRAIALMLVRSITAVLIVLSALELCVAISASVLGIKALRKREKTEVNYLKSPNSHHLKMTDLKFYHSCSFISVRSLTSIKGKTFRRQW